MLKTASVSPDQSPAACRRDSLKAASELKSKFPSLAGIPHCRDVIAHHRFQVLIAPSHRPPMVAGEKAIVRVRRLDHEFVLSEKTESFCKSLAQVSLLPARLGACWC